MQIPSGYPEGIADLGNKVGVDVHGVAGVDAQFVVCQLIPRQDSHSPCEVRACSDIKECMAVCLKL